MGVFGSNVVLDPDGVGVLYVTNEALDVQERVLVALQTSDTLYTRASKADVL